MSKDPFEELFGPEIHENDSVPPPVSARGQQEHPTQPMPTQARTSQLPATRVSEPVAAPGAAYPAPPVSARGAQPGSGIRRTGQPAAQPAPVQRSNWQAPAQQPLRGQAPQEPESRGGQAKPWIVVAIIAVLAIVVALVVVNMARGANTNDEAGPTTEPMKPTQTTQPEGTTDPADPEEPGDPEVDPEEESEGDQPPKVEIGNTGLMQVGDWGVSGQISEKFGWPTFDIDGDRLIFDGSPLINSLPESCSKEWGVKKVGDSKFEALKPATRCEAAPELYDELWGLTAELAKTFK